MTCCNIDTISFFDLKIATGLAMGLYNYAVLWMEQNAIYSPSYAIYKRSCPKAAPSRAGLKLELEITNLSLKNSRVLQMSQLRTTANGHMTSICAQIEITNLSLKNSTNLSLKIVGYKCPLCIHHNLKVQI